VSSFNNFFSFNIKRENIIENNQYLENLIKPLIVLTQTLAKGKNATVVWNCLKNSEMLTREWDEIVCRPNITRISWKRTEGNWYIIAGHGSEQIPKRLIQLLNKKTHSLIFFQTNNFILVIC